MWYLLVLYSDRFLMAGGRKCMLYLYIKIKIQYVYIFERVSSARCQRIMFNVLAQCTCRASSSHTTPHPSSHIHQSTSPPRWPKQGPYDSYPQQSLIWCRRTHTVERAATIQEGIIASIHVFTSRLKTLLFSPYYL